MYSFANGSYQKMAGNERGHYLIKPLEVELGVWQGSYQNQTQLWLRWWDREGSLLLTGAEKAEVERARGDRESQRAEQAEQAQRNAIPQLLATGMSAKQVAQILSLTVEEVKQISDT